MNPIISIQSMLGSVLREEASSGRLPAQSVPAIVEKFAERIEADPVVKNELNLEKPVQSRVVWGSVVSAAGVLIPAIFTLLSTLGINLTEEDSNYVLQLIGAAAALWGAGYALYGRLRSGLLPLFSRK